MNRTDVMSQSDGHIGTTTVGDSKTVIKLSENPVLLPKFTDVLTVLPGETLL